MKRLILLALFTASLAHAGGVVLGPPAKPDPVEAGSTASLAAGVVSCIVDSLSQGLDPSEECDL